jgi:amino acid transporter
MQTDKPDEKLIRGVGTMGATALNMIDMIGVGPFITMPLIIAAMGGPQAMIGWIVGAVLVACDGLVWAELGASMPKSGGPYNYLKEIYGPQPARAADVVPVHLAADLQRSAFDSIGQHWVCGLRDVRVSFAQL